MANEDLPRIWEQFIDAAEKGTKKGGTRIYKMGFCKTALKCSDKLIEHGYNIGERYTLWQKYYGKICATLEGDDEMIQSMHLSKFSQLKYFLQGLYESTF